MPEGQIYAAKATAASLFQTMSDQRHDMLFSEAKRCLGDPRPETIDLVIGVYKDEQGQTPLMKAVDQAQKRLAQSGHTKLYGPLAGDHAFNSGLKSLILKSPDLCERTIAHQTPGSTGAIRLMAELCQCHSPRARLHMPEPSYINHAPIFKRVGMEVKSFDYFDGQGKINIQGFLDQIRSAQAGDLLLLQAGCHNPSGLDLEFEHWQILTKACQDYGLIPIVDLAYAGLCQDFEADMQGLRYMAQNLEAMMIAFSASKSFGLYNDRTGCALFVTPDHKTAQTVGINCENLTRLNYSVPPHHGAALVREILYDAPLHMIWAEELKQMRLRLRDLRLMLAQYLGDLEPEFPIGALIEGHGLFTLLPLGPQSMGRLSQAFAIYGATNGRINLAGLNRNNLERFANALAQVWREA